MKQELILIKVGEIALKGLNRRTFEDVLMKNIKRHLAPLGKFEVRSAQSTIYVRPLEEGVDLDDACERVGKVFGIAAYSRACMAKKDMDDINRTAAEYLKEALEEASTFKVEAKRSDKAFPLKSPAICAETGGYLLERFPNLSVDVHEPDITVTVEIRDFGAYVRGEAERAASGRRKRLRSCWPGFRNTAAGCGCSPCPLPKYRRRSRPGARRSCSLSSCAA